MTTIVVAIVRWYKAVCITLGAGRGERVNDDIPSTPPEPLRRHTYAKRSARREMARSQAASSFAARSAGFASRDRPGPGDG